MLKIAYWFAPLYTALIVFLSLGDNVAPAINVTHIDKVYHATAYAIMTVVWYIFFYVRTILKYASVVYTLKTVFANFQGLIIAATAALCFIIGVLLEAGQGFISTNRTMDFLDIIANTSGIIIATVILKLTANFLRKNAA